jgi:trans-aconitate methyltransferase
MTTEVLIYSLNDLAIMTWNAACYQSQHSYVWQHGESLLAQLAPQVGEQILDLGCGTGQLTEKIASSGAQVLGIDSDPAMIAQARTNYPHISFQTADATNFDLPAPVDAVFSNAVLHWVPQAESAARCIARALKPGGRFVAEFGGKGNVQTILSALQAVSGQTNLNPWYFPSLGEYASLLETAGLEVVYAHLFERPTPLGEAGLAGWLEMFAQRSFAALSADEWAAIVKAVEAAVPQLCQSEKGQGEKGQDEAWIADYRRLRMVAIK